MKTSAAFALRFRHHFLWNGSTVLLEDNTTSYIVRVWLEHRDIEDAPVTWRGTIEHVANGRVKYLTDLGEIARFIQPFLEAMGVKFAGRTDTKDQ